MERQASLDMELPPMTARDAMASMIGTDMAYGVAVLLRDGKEVARANCSMLPVTWFAPLQEQARLGDLVEVRLARPLNRTERFYMATANHNGFVTGYCTESQWKWRPAKPRRGR